MRTKFRCIIYTLEPNKLSSGNSVAIPLLGMKKKTLQLKSGEPYLFYLNHNNILQNTEKGGKYINIAINIFISNFKGYFLNYISFRKFYFYLDRVKHSFSNLIQ